MKKYLLFCILSLSATGMYAQSNLMLDNSYEMEEMIMDFFSNTAVTPSNITYEGLPLSYGFFDAADTDLPINAGIVISTGYLLDQPSGGIGINNPASAFAATDTNSNPDDPDLNSLSSGEAFNTFVIEFDFVPAESGLLSFSYVFGSEEYPEYACTSFNDVFGFFVSGPGINGPYEGNAANISRIPTTNEVVSINTLHPENPEIPLDCDPYNEQFYIDNSDSEDVVFDGITTELPADFEVVAGETYHAKILVTDVADPVWDSGVFIGYNSLGNPDSLVPPANFELLMANYDEVQIVNNSKYARNYEWNFSDGTSSTDRHPTNIIVNEPGTLVVDLSTSNYCCTDFQQLEITLPDIEPLDVELDLTNAIVDCFGDQSASIDLTPKGGVPPYFVDWEPAIPNIDQVAAGIYTYTISDQNGIQISGTVTVTQPESPLDLEVLSDPFTNSAAAFASGGTAPYSYAWSDGSETQEISNLAPGTYAVTVTDANACQAFAEFELETVNSLSDQSNPAIIIHPNPVRDQLFIEGIPGESIYSLRVFDIQGREIFLKRTGNQIEFSQNMPKGMYILQLQNMKQETTIIRFLKD
ncbi:MAG: T9SS type A sorting domain-containing protein [Bacteroidetes bacterium]|nr:T9SS type A sorting domain-containing protein [Bacteroidota bacterium]